MSFCPEKVVFSHKNITGKACIHCGAAGLSGQPNTSPEEENGEAHKQVIAFKFNLIPI